MQIHVDYDKCESNGMCMSIAPEIFEIRDDDVMYLLAPDATGANEAKVLQAVRTCPKQALSVR
jgi:ferredoxin